MSTPSAIVLYAPAAIRHDPLPDAATSARILPGSADGLHAGANTVIVPGCLIPATQRGPAGHSSLQPAFLLRPARPGSWLPYTLMSYTGDDLLYIRLPGPPVRGTPASTACRARWAATLSARHRAHGGQLNNHACWRRNLLLPGAEDSDEGGAGLADVGVWQGPAAGLAAGPWWWWCLWLWVRCRCQVSVTSVTAARAACSSTMVLLAA